MSAAHDETLTHADDVCALPLVRRLAALLDCDPGSFRTGDTLPRGWHVMLFNTPTRQSSLRADGVAHLGVTLPDIGLPRLMLGGRTVAFKGDIAIGAQLRRETRQGETRTKQGRSGRFALVTLEHRIFSEDAHEPVLVEVNEYVLREAASFANGPNAAPEEPAQAGPPQAEAGSTPAADATRSIMPDEPMLFRYSAITDNPHRVHYDLPYATRAEGYPALLVNGSIPAMFLLKLFHEVSGAEPTRFTSRNLAPMFCGQPLALSARQVNDGWRLWAQNRTGTITLEAHAA